MVVLVKIMNHMVTEKETVLCLLGSGENVAQKETKVCISECKALYGWHYPCKERGITFSK